MLLLPYGNVSVFLPACREKTQYRSTQAPQFRSSLVASLSSIRKGLSYITSSLRETSSATCPDSLWPDSHDCFDEFLEPLSHTPKHHQIHTPLSQPHTIPAVHNPPLTTEKIISKLRAIRQGYVEKSSRVTTARTWKQRVAVCCTDGNTSLPIELNVRKIYSSTAGRSFMTNVNSLHQDHADCTGESCEENKNDSSPRAALSN